MNCRVLCSAAIIFAVACGLRSAHAGDLDKIHTVGKDGLVLHGKVEATDSKVKVIDGDRSGVLPAKMYQVQLAAGKKYRVSMDSKEIDSVLVVQDKSGRQLAWDDDGGGDVNSLLTIEIPADGAYKIYAASLKGTGGFVLKIRDDGEAKTANARIHEVGGGLKINGELGKLPAITYKVKLLAGKTYVIDMISPNQQALDPFLRLLDASGKQLAEDDDGGVGLNARIIHKAENTEAYLVVATSFDNGRGPFTLTVRDGLEELANQSKLLGAAHWKVVDFRLALAELELLAKMNAAQRAKVATARELAAKVIALYQAGKAGQALQVAQEALEFRKEVLGEKHPDYATSLHNVASLYSSQGNDAKAEPLFVKALEIHKEVLGEKHPEYATSLNNVAVLYNAQGNYFKAEPLFVKALEIHKEILGEKHAHYVGSLSNLGSVYASQENLAKAEALYVRALEIKKEILGEKHPDYAVGLNNLGFLYSSQGNDAKAEALFVKALEIHKDIRGEKHPDYATSLSNMASLYSRQGKHAKAEPVFVKALEIRKEVLGEKHPDYALSLNNLAFLYSSQGKHAKAEPLFVKSLRIRKEVHGEKHPDYIISLNNLAGLFHAQEEYVKAVPLLAKALLASQIAKNPVPFEISSRMTSAFIHRRLKFFWVMSC